MGLSYSSGRTGTASRLRSFGLELADGDLLVIHAMKLRRAYREDYVRVMECAGR